MEKCSNLVLSLDCETNGLYGQPFALSAVVFDTKKMVPMDTFTARCPIVGPLNEWVNTNVIPALAGMAETHPDEMSMRSAFWEFWRKCSPITTIAHIAAPVESNFFRQCVMDDLDNRQWNGPFPIHEVGTALYLRGYDPATVDGFIKEKSLVVPFDGTSHHPTYDAMAAAVAWSHLINKG